MALTREQIVDTAFAMLRDGGLAGLTMRRLAARLEVQPGALYYHVASKQELLVAVAARILADEEEALATADPRAAARSLRAALLRVRDGAEVVSFAQAFRPDSLTPLRELRRLFVPRLAPREADWAAQTLVHYVLGHVAEEQNHAELVRAKALPEAQPRPATSRAFLFGVDAILAGVDASRST